MNRAGFGVSLLCALTTVVVGCSATVAGTPTPAERAPVAQGTPLSTSPQSPTANPLPSELDGFTITSDTEDMDTETLFTSVVVNTARWSRALGTDLSVPVAVPRTNPTACLIIHRVARACDDRIEYDVDQLTEDRSAFGDLPVRLIAAHETGHFIIAAMGGDTPNTTDTDSEARANCIAGAYIATDPAITSSTAGEAYNRTPLPQAGQGSYTAFQRGFTTLREGVNPLSLCVGVTG